MGLQSIPNQPLNFGGTMFQGCAPCTPVQDVTFIEAGTDIVAQFTIDQCGEAQLLAAPDFGAGTTDWGGDGWSLRDGSACLVASGVAPGPNILQEVSAGLTPGSDYVAIVIVDSIAGGVTVAAGAVELGRITAPGTYVYTFTAQSAQSISFEVDDEDTSVCLAQAEMYAQRADFSVEIFEAPGGGYPVASFDWSDAVFSVDGSWLTMEIPTDGLDDGCYVLTITDECDEVELTSNVLQITSDPCVSLKTCNNGPQFGFSEGFMPSIAIPGKLTRPSYAYQTEQVRGASGRVLRHYAQRTTAMELRILTVGETMHQFLSSLSLWGHVYLDQTEVIVTNDSYEPDYGDVYDMGAPALLTVEPQGSAITMTLCDEPTGGCTPPPNFLVQGVGPNTDYILLQDGGRIELH